MNTKSKISIAFLGALVPDTEQYQNIALRRSGNLVQDGIACGLKSAGAEIEIFSVRPEPSFPRSRKLFLRGKTIDYKGIRMHLMSFLNILGIKTLWISLAEIFALIRWAISNRHNKRAIIVYNTYTPPLPIVLFIGMLTRSKTFAILYDLGMPPKELKMGSVRTFIYRCVELSAKTFIPRLDGRITINDAIGQDYAKGEDYIIVDGGLSDEVLSRLSKIKHNRQDSGRLNLCMGGSLSPINGSRIIGELVEKYDLSDFKIIIAGGGHDEAYIKELAEKFPEVIDFRGMLNLDQLFDVYNQCDILMNLRILPEEDKYLFPSKVIEYMTTGVPTITTNAGHIKKEYGELCVVLESQTPEALYDALNRMKETALDELMQKGKNAKDFMLNTHTWEAQSKKIFEYIQKKIC